MLCRGNDTRSAAADGSPKAFSEDFWTTLSILLHTSKSTEFAVISMFQAPHPPDRIHAIISHRKEEGKKGLRTVAGMVIML